MQLQVTDKTRKRLEGFLGGRNLADDDSIYHTDYEVTTVLKTLKHTHRPYHIDIRRRYNSEEELGKIRQLLN